MILIIDNYDSFVYNLARYVKEIGYECQVQRNDALTLSDIRELAPTHIIISPGPCTPQKAGISIDVVRNFGPYIPILGVCLGHQSIGEAYGGKTVPAREPMHGKIRPVLHKSTGIFTQLPNPLNVTRYHSLVIDPVTLPEQLVITATSELGEIMGVAHKVYPVIGVQFHPEAVLTEAGHIMLQNFINGHHQ